MKLVTIFEEINKPNKNLISEQSIFGFIRRFAPTFESEVRTDVARLLRKNAVDVTDGDIATVFTKYKDRDLALLKRNISTSFYMSNRKTIDRIFSKYNLGDKSQAIAAARELQTKLKVPEELLNDITLTWKKTNKNVKPPVPGQQKTTGLGSLKSNFSVQDLVDGVKSDPIFGPLMKKAGVESKFREFVNTEVKAKGITPNDIWANDTNLKKYFDRVQEGINTGKIKTGGVVRKIGDIVAAIPTSRTAKITLGVWVIGVLGGAWTISDTWDYIKNFTKKQFTKSEPTQPQQTQPSDKSKWDQYLDKSN